MPTLAVLVGAGASYDCSTPAATIRDEWKPPLVNELFGSRARSFGPVLQKYPKAEALAGEILAALANKQTLEQFLKTAMNERSASVRRPYREVPLYLQELVGEVSAHYFAMGASVFARLVMEIERLVGEKFERVAYLTTNYDLFLDRALSTLYDHPLRSMDDYVSGRNWSLVKLHGSVNWGRPIFKTDAAPADLRRNLELLAKLEHEPHEIESEIRHVGGHQDRSYQGEFMYPALVVPVEGKSGLVCPQGHSDVARAAMSESTHMLIIGCRVADEDVLELFDVATSLNALMVVSKPEDDALATIDRLAVRNKAVVALKHYSNCHYGNGFYEFVMDGSLKNFLNK